MYTWIVSGYSKSVVVKADTKNEAKQLGREAGAGAGCKADKI